MGSSVGRADSTPATAPDSNLTDLIQRYFTETDSSKRAEIRVSIETCEGVDVAQVIEALGRANVWEPMRAGPTDIACETATGRQRTARLIVPEGYHPSVSYPLVVLLYEGPLAEAETFSQIITQDIGPVLIAMPRDLAGGAFASPSREAGEPANLLREIRQRCHVDTDRVYVVGAGGGNGAAAINLALFHTHWISGAIALEPVPDVPYPRQAYPFLLRNLAGTPLFIAYTGPSASRPASRPADELAPPDPLEVIEAVADRQKLPVRVKRFEDISLSPAKPWTDALVDVWNARRDANAHDVSHWFRYPAQGRMGWLRQEAFDGEPWEDSLITILSAPSTDFHTYATKVLQSKLAYLGGRIDGQRITITTQRTDRLELRLHEGLLDLSRPIEIEWAGHTRATVRVTPRISTVLETAYEDWDLQHPASVRLIAHRNGTLDQR